MLQEELLIIKKSTNVGNATKGGGTVLVIVFLVITVVIILYFYLKKKGYLSNLLNVKSKEQKMFEDAAIVRGIPKDLVNAILSVIDYVPIKSPVLLFASKQNFETFLIRVLSTLKTKDKNFGNLNLTLIKNKLYSLLSNLDDYFTDNKKQVSSRDLNVGKRARIYIADYGYFFTEVVAVLDKGFVIKKPKLDREPKSWKLPVTVYFWRENDAGYSFETFIEDEVSESTISGLLVRNSNTMLRYQKRKYIRKECRFYANYVLVEIQTDSNGKKSLKVIPPEYDGTVFDIGAGGFAIEVVTKIPVKKLIKTNIFIGRQSIKGIAEVIRFERAGEKFHMHAKFLKISALDQNIIYEFVYSKLIK